MGSLYPPCSGSTEIPDSVASCVLCGLNSVPFPNPTPPKMHMVTLSLPGLLDVTIRR